MKANALARNIKAGRSLNDQTIQRRGHRVSVAWERRPFNIVLGNTCYLGYTDDSYLPDTAPRKVGDYSRWDLSASWKPTQALPLRAGVLNLLDKVPPFSNQSYDFLSTYDPTYTDPRGRSGSVSLAYSFK